MKFQVAIVGSPGSGKTVLTAVLSRYLSGHSDKVYMNPKKANQYKGKDVVPSSTISYVSKTMELLHRGQWEIGTSEDTKCELGFDLHIGGNKYEMNLLDSSGEDLKRIWSTYDENILTPFQKKLRKYILDSNVVIIIVNLDHFANAPTLVEKTENENILKEVVDHLVEAETCHYILVCFTAYDKYEEYIKQKYGGMFIHYLRRELPMFFRSCEVAARKVVCDGTEYDLGQKKIRLDCIAVAPVIEQAPVPGINPDRYGKPPIGFDVRDNRHSRGLAQIADWLCMCEQSERHWSEVNGKIEDKQKMHGALMYRLFPIIMGMVVSVLALLVLPELITGRTITFPQLVNLLLLFGLPIGAGIGFLVGDKIFVLIKNKDGLVFRKNRSRDGEQQEESVTAPPTGTGGTSTASSRPSGTGGASTGSSRPSGTGGASTGSSRPSGTGGTAATSGAETID